MAIYPYKCSVCEKVDEVVQSISSYCESPNVPECCGFKMERMLTRPLIAFDFAPWKAVKSSIDGSVLDSRSKQKEHMAKHGVVLYDDLAPDFERNRQDKISAQRKQVKADIVEAVQRLESGQKAPTLESVNNIVPVEA